MTQDIRNAAKATEKQVREGSEVKREAIVSAARELFLKEGFDRTSMDAISSMANVSKRTVYDYFGDKANLLAAVLETATEALFSALRESLDSHLSNSAPINSLQDLEAALSAFAVDISTTVIGSTNYTTVFALTSGLRTEFPALNSHTYSNAPEVAISERLTHFHQRGLLSITDAREAADHFIALTVLLAYSNKPGPNLADQQMVEKTVKGGVKAFMRAYARSDKHS